MNENRKISAEGRALIEKWEECVLYVYDDKVAKRHINGKLQYPEWDGGQVVGTLTIGYGHTDAAGYPKIKQGLRITKEQADEILGDDLSPCERSVRQIVKVVLGQHQFDTLTSFTFNCGAGNLKKLVIKLNAGNYDDIPRHLMQFVSSKGERMAGLVNRRTAEASLWMMPDDPDDAEAQGLFAPQAEENDPPKSIAASKSGNSALALGGISATTALSAASDAADKLNDASDKFQGLGAHAKSLGLTDVLSGFAHSPMAIVALLGIGLAGFVYWDRYRRLTQDHV